MKFPYPSINNIRIARKALIYLATLISTLHRRKDSDLWAKYWKLYSSVISSSFLGKLKGIVSLPDEYRAVIRLFNHSDFIVFRRYLKRRFTRDTADLGRVMWSLMLVRI